MIGVALVSFLAIFASSIKTSGAGTFRDDFRGNVIVDSGAIDDSSGLTPSLATDLATQPGVHTLTEQRVAAVETKGAPGLLNAYDTSTVATMFDLGHIDGDLPRLGTDGIAVSAQTGPGAVELGDTRTVTFQTGTATYTVRAIYENASDTVGTSFVDLAAFDNRLPEALDARIYVDADDTTAVASATTGYPTAKVLTTETFIAQQNRNLDTILTLMYALLSLAVLIALLGIANTLALSIHERKRELGLLRAVGMSRAQVRSSVRWESVIIALFGAGIGLTMGTFVAWAMIHAVTGGGHGGVVIPVGSLAMVTGIAAIAGVAAALQPARRAARINILTALTTA